MIPPKPPIEGCSQHSGKSQKTFNVSGCKLVTRCDPAGAGIRNTAALSVRIKRIKDC